MKKVKKVLAGVGIAGLLTAAHTAVAGPTGASGWSADKKGAVSTEEVKKPVPSGEQEDSAVSIEKIKKKPAASGWSADKKGAVSTQEVEEEVKKEKKPAKKSGDSGWSGSR